MREILESLEGQLTVTLQMDDADLPYAQKLLPVLERKAGRLLVNGFPTGVEVAHAMVHGGPFPRPRMGARPRWAAFAIYRFLRPVCYQDFPAALLPEALRDGNPAGFRAGSTESLLGRAHSGEGAIASSSLPTVATASKLSSQESRVRDLRASKSGSLGVIGWSRASSPRRWGG